MKKLFITWGFVAAALTLFGCAKQEASLQDAQPAKAGVPFELVAGIDTKTTAESISSIKWAANDAIAVFHTAAGSTVYGTRDKFTIAEEDLASNMFKGTVTDAFEASNDWYVFYPHNDYVTPDGVGYVAVGGNMTQNFTKPMAHLAGNRFPLYGKAEGVANGTSPSITMNQAMSVVKVHVTNDSGAALDVTSVSFATEDYEITGQFKINFEGNTPVFTPKDGSTGKSVTLSVSNTTPLADGASADYYIAVAPFNAAAGKKLTLTVNDLSKGITLPAAVSFVPGKVKTVNFNYDKAATPATLPFAIDGTGGSAAYSSTNGLSSSGLGSNYDSKHSPYLTKFDSTGDFIQIHYDVPAGKVSFGVKMIGGASTSSMTLSGSAGGTSFTDIETFSISGSQNDVKNFTSSNAIDASYRYLRLTFTKGSNIGFGPFSVALPSTDPVISVTSDNPMAVTNANDLYAIEYTIINPVGGKSISAATDVDWITDFDYSTPGEVAFEVAAQASGAPARSGSITLSYDGADDVIVVVNQEKGANLSGVYNCTFSSKSWDVASGADFSWTSGKDGAGFSNNGIQVTTAVTGANGTTNKSFTSVSKVVVTYNTNKSAGAGTLDLKIGSNTAHSQNWAYSSGDGRTANYTCTFNIATSESGQIKLTVNTTTNSIYVVGVSVTASGMSNP